MAASAMAEPETPPISVLSTTLTCASDEECRDPCRELFACTDGVCVLGPVDRDQDADGFIDAVCVGGDDCDDQDPEELPGQVWYADCDGDGQFVDAPAVSCQRPATPSCSGRP